MTFSEYVNKIFLAFNEINTIFGNITINLKSNFIIKTIIFIALISFSFWVLIETIKIARLDTQNDTIKEQAKYLNKLKKERRKQND